MNWLKHFREKKNVITPLHVKDINVENDEVHGPLFVVLET